MTKIFLFKIINLIDYGLLVETNDLDINGITIPVNETIEVKGREWVMKFTEYRDGPKFN